MLPREFCYHHRCSGAVGQVVPAGSVVLIQRIVLLLFIYFCLLFSRTWLRAAECAGPDAEPQPFRAVDASQPPPSRLFVYFLFI